MLLGRHYGTAYRVAYRWCGTRQDAEDVAQEAFIKVARGIRSFRGNASFTTWLYRIVVNAANDLHRRNAARVRLADEAVRRAAPRLRPIPHPAATQSGPWRPWQRSRRSSEQPCSSSAARD